MARAGQSEQCSDPVYKTGNAARKALLGARAGWLRRRSSLDSRSSRLLSAGLTGLKGAMAAKQRLDYRTLVPWPDERSYVNEAARSHHGPSPFATTTGQ